MYISIFSGKKQRNLSRNMKISRHKISIVLPVLNEAGNIVPLLEGILQQLNGSRFEAIIVDDGSNDGTTSVIRGYQNKHSWVKLLHHSKPKDLGGSIKMGVLRAHGDIIVGMDGDGNHDPAALPLLIAALDSADLVVGSRFESGGGMQSHIRYGLTLVFNWFLRTWYAFPIWDNTSGYYAIKRTTLEQLPLDVIYRGYGEYHLRLVYILSRKKAVLKEIPVYYHDRIYGQSKSVFRTMVKTYLQVARELQAQYS